MENINIVFDSGFDCTKDFYLHVKNQVLEVVPIVRLEHPNIKWTVEQLCGEIFWSELSDGQHRIAGMCMVLLTEMEELPFKNVPRNGKNPYPLLYKIKNTG